MPHRLFIKTKIDSAPEYKKFLSENETVAGRDAELVVVIENMGDTSVPEGNVEVTLEKPIAFGSFTASIKPFKMPTIKPNENFTGKLKVSGGVLVDPGLWSIHVIVKLGDKEQIEYYQSKEWPPDIDKWSKFFYVVDRHRLDLQSLLERLVERKEE